MLPHRSNKAIRSYPFGCFLDLQFFSVQKAGWKSSGLRAPTMVFAMTSASGTIINLLGNCLLLLFQNFCVESFYMQAKYYNIKKLPPVEFEHAAVMYTTELPRNISGSDVQVTDPKYSPDFRIEEPPYTRYKHKEEFEEERPYRISPHYKQIRLFRNSYKMAGCTCVTTYRKFHVLAACAVITTRHILTTATSTELVLRKRRHFQHLENILGFWYDTDVNSYNSSMYAHIARIHYHHHYLRPKLVNRTHPFPVVFDLALWAATHRFYTAILFGSAVVVCPRAGSHTFEHSSSVPTLNEKKERIALITGWQFMKAFKRKIMPWFKYLVQTKRHVWPCPKVEWGWFHCVKGNWAKLGLDNGSPLFRITKSGWRYDGLVGLNMISMKLRSYDMIHYFQVLDSHVVMDFLYDAMIGRPKYEWLDFRFYDSQGRSPAPKCDTLIFWNYTFGEDQYNSELPNY